MQIRLRDIPAEGLEIKEALSLDALNSRMSEGRENDIEFVSAPSASIRVFQVPGGAEASGTVSGRVRRPCPKCFEEVETSLEEKISISLKQRPEEETKKSSKRSGAQLHEREWEDDIGVLFFEGEHIDLEEFLQETLILAINPFECPHEGCPGYVQAEQAESASFTLADKLNEAVKRKNGRS